MSKPPVRTILILGLPLLLIAGYVLWTSGNPDVDTENFVHPPLSAGTTGLPASGGLAPSRENVTDAYFHEVFIFQERLRSNPEDTLAMRKLGRLLQDGHRMASADSAYTSYLLRRRRARQVWLDLAAARAGDKRWDDAETAIHEMLDEYPGDASAYYNLGAIAANRGDFNRARTEWERTMALSSDSTVIRMARNALARLSIP